jgi:hypothetical protein
MREETVERRKSEKPKRLVKAVTEDDDRYNDAEEYFRETSVIEEENEEEFDSDVSESDPGKFESRFTINSIILKFFIRDSVIQT